MFTVRQRPDPRPGPLRQLFGSSGPWEPAQVRANNLDPKALFYHYDGAAREAARRNLKDGLT